MDFHRSFEGFLEEVPESRAFSLLSNRRYAVRTEKVPSGETDQVTVSEAPQTLRGVPWIATISKGRR